MVRASACGRARRGDAFTADWTAVRCADCHQRRPADRVSCIHCNGPVDGSCLHLARIDRWLHVACRAEFERSRLGRHLLTAFPRLYDPERCSKCGEPGPDHGPGCRGAPLTKAPAL